MIVTLLDIFVRILVEFLVFCLQGGMYLLTAYQVWTRVMFASYIVVIYPL